MLTLAIAVTVTLALNSCAAASAPRPTATTDATSLAEVAEEQLESLPGVETVLAGQSAIASETADPWNPDLWSISIGVTMAAEATLDEVVAAAEATHDFSVQHSGEGRWSAQIYAGGPAETVIEDTTALSAVQFDVFPQVWQSPADAARASFEVKAIPGVNRVAITADWPYLQTAGAVQLGTTYPQVQQSELFSSGGSYSTADGRVRLIDLPHRVSDATITAIIGVAAAYPQAEIALEAPLEGEQWPQLYLNHVATNEAAVITEMLTWSPLAAERVDGYAIPFFMRVSAPDGQTDVSDLIGG
jgi:hypothetical protein